MPKQSYDYKISKKVFTAQDFTTLIDLIAEYLPKRKSKDLYPPKSVRLTMTSSDGIGHEYSNVDMLDSKSLLVTKKIISFKAVYTDRDDDTSLLINFDESKYGLNYISITSSNPTAFNAFRTQINDYLNNVKDQTNFYIAHRDFLKPTIEFVLASPITYLMLVLLNFWLVTFDPDPVKREITTTQYWLAIAILIVLLFFMNLINSHAFTSKITAALDSLWPDIEFNLGPDHLNVAKKRRNVTTAVGLNFVLPLIFALLTMPITNLLS